MSVMTLLGLLIPALAAPTEHSRMFEDMGKRRPEWHVKGAPDTGKKLCGFDMPPSDKVHTAEVYHAVPSVGTYNHAVMLDWYDSFFLLTWKNSPRDEDEAGQRILYSTSVDGSTWSATDGRNIMFPNISTSATPAALFAGPAAILNGRRYASASPHQFCLFPDPYKDVLLLRRIDPPSANGSVQLGPVFWAAASVPSGFEEASTLNGIVPLSAMDKQTQDDVAILSDWSRLPCATETEGTLKCEACVGGCDSNRHEMAGLGMGGGAEYTHYQIPGGSEEMMLHRTKEHELMFGHRDNATMPWRGPYHSNLPDADSNLNAGRLPGGQIYLVSNACTRGRDPLVVSTSKDGWRFEHAIGVMSCEGLGQCGARIGGKSKSHGVSYPQATTVLGPGTLAGLYVAASNNKEDIWVAKLDFDALPDIVQVL